MSKNLSYLNGRNETAIVLKALTQIEDDRDHSFGIASCYRRHFLMFLFGA